MNIQRLITAANPHRVHARFGAALLVGVAVSWSLPLGAQPIAIETVLVGDPGNPADPLNSGSVPGIGSVGSSYRIGKYEVTNAQYATFLNAVAATDTFNLYSTSMASDARGGIDRTGSSGSYSYAPKPGYEAMPVVHVSFWDAARFTNWLATGSTEGRAAPASPLLPGAAYDLGFTASPAFAAGNRLGGASIFLPSENEWYKAAYYQPSTAGGDADSYWLYATGSNTQPTSATPGAGVDRVNYFFNDGIANGINRGYAVTQSGTFVSSENYLTDVGAYGAASESYHGTADQNGNVWEWSDTAVTGTTLGLKGGAWNLGELNLQSSDRFSFDPSSGNNSIGFRVASLAPIPEPRALGAFAGLAALARVLGCRRGRSAV